MSTGVQIDDHGFPYVYFDGYVHIDNNAQVTIEACISNDDDDILPVVRIPPGGGDCISLPRPDGWTRDDDLDELLAGWMLYVKFDGMGIKREYDLLNLDGDNIKYDVIVNEDFTISNNSKYI